MREFKRAGLTVVLSCLIGWGAVPVGAQEHPEMPFNIGAAKLIVGDVKANEAFYEQMFGMKEVRRYQTKDYDEPIMGFEDGARLALFSPLSEAPLKKSQFPVAVLYTPDLDAVVKRLQDAKFPVLRLDAAQSGTMQIAIARDPSDNAIELVSRPGKWEVGGSKLIVNDRQKAEDFISRIFGAKPLRRYTRPDYDEVLMTFGSGPFLALFQPMKEAPLPKSEHPVVAIYTSEFDAVLKRVSDAGFGHREISAGSPPMKIIIAKDPAGNAIEIIKRDAR